ncbi:MAG: SpoIIE family protein phosphatase [Gemmobacter sp.]
MPSAMRAAPPPRRVLVVDDSRAQRRVLAVWLRRWGYEVAEAASGAEALDLCRAAPFDIVLSDWVMPGMSGLDLCRAFRRLPQEGYGFFILLTSHSGKGEIARGLDVGADDFLAKPVDPDELRARLKAGARLVSMQRELAARNSQLGDTLAELRGVYGSLHRDLWEARRLQQALARDRQMDFGRATVSLLLRPSGQVGGDLVGCFPLGAGRVAFYAVDVSGHGVASGMMAARLAGMFSGAAPDGNPAFRPCPRAARRPPEEVAARLNRMVIEDMQVDQYLTCVYADADTASGAVSFVQAGHPHPLLLRASGTVRRVGAGGLPVGLIPGAGYERVRLRLREGDRLLLVSDGFTDCLSPDGTPLGEDGLARMVARHRNLAGCAFLDALLAGAEDFTGGRDIADDISAVLYEYGAEGA